MTDRCSVQTPKKASNAIVAGCTARWALQAFGWLCVILGVIGAVVPGLPTTVFLIMAVWAFSRSSERLRLWLWNHPRFGRSIQAWHGHRVIPVRAKVLALAIMSGSFAFLSLSVANSWVLPAVVAAVMIPAGTYVATRSSAPPQGAAPIPQSKSAYKGAPATIRFGVASRATPGLMRTSMDL